MSNGYNINDWARDQRNAEDQENILEAAFMLRQKFPKTNKIITIIMSVAFFFSGISYGIALDRQPIGIFLWGVLVSAIGGFITYVAGLLILTFVVVAGLIGLIIKFL